MQIEENKIFLFKFHTDSGELAIPVRAESREQAADVLQKMLGRMLSEVTVDFPRTSAPLESAFDETTIAIIAGLEVPPEVLELRIDTLLTDLGAGNLNPGAKATTVKNFTDLDYSESNYPQIISELELIKTGQREVPIKKKNEKKKDD